MLRKLILTAATLHIANKVYRDYRNKQRASGGSAGTGYSPVGAGPATDLAGHDLDVGSTSGLGVNTGAEPSLNRPGSMSH
ncbi:hypothetical protein [Aquabacterium sp. J223]|uniref:hypothetical protein n=1 Tax=Aquabacterium sp. J223 TaxID=2898431 RepID=UPI0021ADDD2B|nr:hypothetical protein [Aquabacterium sp. J223]UUX96195.1 hypothetical protein LRS07_02350 [Aquabacterium sp. J223]